ncbi:hypothetical protein P7C70_g3807, partial [Phenoliferia sp. Uapishka_3]
MSGGLQLDIECAEPEDPFAHLMSAFEPVTPHSDSSGSESEPEQDEQDSQPSPDSTSVEMELDSFFVDPVSQMPSPAVTSYSPSELHDTLAPFPEGVDSFADLQAILANDPCHPNGVEPTQTMDGSDGFNYDHFAASLEGPSGGSAISFEDLLSTQVSAQAYPTPGSSRHAVLHQKPQRPSHLDYNFDQYSAARIQAEERIAFQAALVAAPLPCPPDVRLASRASMSMPSMSMPSMSIPSTSDISTSFPLPNIPHSAASFQHAFASSFPSLTVMPNGLGLHDATSPHSILFDAYTRRKEYASTTSANGLPTPPTPTPQPAFYMPASWAHTSDSR